MEPFAVECTTCKARLKVRDPAAVGQILSCPKCSSMVLVAPPPGWTGAEERSEVGSRKSEAAGRTEGTATASANATGALQPAVAATHSSPPPLPQAVKAAEPANAAVVKTASAGWIQSIGGWPALIAASAAGIGLAVSLWLLVVKLAGGSTEAQSPAAARNVASRSPAAISAVPPSSRGAAGARAPSKSTRNVSSPRKSRVSGDVHLPGSAIDAPNSDRADNAGSDDGPATTPPDNTIAEPAPASDTADAVAPTAASGSPAADGSSAADRLQRALIVERLSAALPQIDFDKQPLASLADFVTQFTAVPVVIDQKALARRDKNGQTAVSVKLSDTTAAEALKAALAPHGLVYEIRGAQVVITAKNDPPAKAR